MASLNWSAWVLGIWGAFISAGAGTASVGLGTMVVDPSDFNLSSGRTKLIEVMIISFLIPGTVSMLKYLSMHAVPDPVPQEVVGSLKVQTTFTPTDKTQPETKIASVTPISTAATPEDKA